MRNEVGEWLATCVGSPICVLLLSWSLLIYQNQPAAGKRRVDVLTVAILAESLAHQLGLLLYAIFTLIHPANHFGEFCSSLVWILNSSSILQELSLTSIAIFVALAIRDEGPTIKKHHLKYHLVSLSVIGACIGVTGVLNFEPDGCVFLAQDISLKYGLFFNGLRCILALTTLFSLLTALFRGVCHPSPKAELLKSVSDLSDASSKHSAFECQHQQHWEPSSGSCTSGSTNSRACLKKRRLEIEDASGWPTLYSILFVCYVFDHLPLLIVSLRPDILGNLCTPQNLATWLPLAKDTLLPVFLAIFDKMFCRYVAKVYTKRSHSTRLTHGGVDGKFRHFEQDNEYKLQLNLNHGLKFPLSGAATGCVASAGSLYGRLHNHPSRARGDTLQLGIHQYCRNGPTSSDNTYASVAPDISATYSNLESPKSPQTRHQQARNLSRANSTSKACEQKQKQQQQQEYGFIARRQGSGEVFGQKLDSLMQLEEQSYGYGARRLKHFAKSLDEIREEAPRRATSRTRLDAGYEASALLLAHRQQQQQHQQQRQRGAVTAPALAASAALRRNQSFDLHGRYPRIELPIVSSRTYDVKRELAIKRSLQMMEQSRRSDAECEENEAGYETSDDESCDRESQDFDTMSSCRSRARSCCSVTTVANDDFEFFQRKGTKELPRQNARVLESKGSMSSFTPRIIEAAKANGPERKPSAISKPVVQSYRLKKKMSPGYSLNDLDKFGNERCPTGRGKPHAAPPPALSIESLKSILRSSDVSYLDNGEICRHDIGGSAPDFKKIFVTEFI